MRLSLFEHPCFFIFSSQPGLIPPHEVLAFPSGEAVLHRVVPVGRPAVWAEGEAEAGCAVADLEEAVGAEEGVSFAASQVVDRLQVVINCSVSQLLPSLHSPPPPQEEDPHNQNQDQDSQNTGEGEGSRGGLDGLAQSWLETGLKCELTTGAHKAHGALAHRPGEVGETRATVLAGMGSAGIRAHAAVLASVSQSAGTGVVIYTILAGSSILAGARGTIINVDLAVGTCETCLTAAQDALAEVQTLTACRGEKTVCSASIKSEGGQSFKEGVLIGLCLLQVHWCKSAESNTLPLRSRGWLLYISATRCR